MTKRYQKAASPYFHNRNSFQSPQCSTVIEVNPSCESQQSMLERIIFPDRMENNYHAIQQKRIALQQRVYNIDPIKNKFDQQYVRKYGSNELSRDKKIQKIESDIYRTRNRPVKDENLRRDYGNNYAENVSTTKSKTLRQKQNYSPRNRLNSLSSAHKETKQQPSLSTRTYNASQELTRNYESHDPIYRQSSSSGIDENRLHRIQQKIRKHQKLQYQSEQHCQQYRKNSLRDAMENQMQKIELDYPLQMKKKPTIIDKIASGNVSRIEVCHEINLNYTEAQKLKQCLQKIYTTVSITPTLPLSSENINLKNLPREEVKLIFGPIFAEVTIRQKKLSRREFVEKAFEILKEYKEQQIEEIFKLISSKKDSRFGHEAVVRIPGKLLRNSKTGDEKSNMNIQRCNKNESKHSTFHQVTSKDTTGRQFQPSQPHQRVTKTVYMESTQRTQPDQANQMRYQQRYQSEIGRSKNTLQMMLAEEKLKQRYVSASQNEEKKQTTNRKHKNLIQNDQELERLNNLERRFNEHFNCRE